MSPIPERRSILPQLFNGLDADDFREAFENIYGLKDNTRSGIMMPPNNEILLSTDRGRCWFTVKEAVLYKGANLVQSLNFFMKSRYRPMSVSSLDYSNRYLKLFGITTSFEEKEQIISVKRDKLPDIKFQHNGLDVPIKDMHRLAIFALAIVPDDLWGKIHSRGFIMGQLFGDTYDIPWNVNYLSSGLPDPNKVVKYGVDMSKDKLNDVNGLLETFSLDTDYDRNNIAIAQKFYKDLSPVGIFIDNRTH